MTTSCDTRAPTRWFLTLPRCRLRVTIDCTCCVNLVRARCSLAFTVPTGSSKILAVSLADNSCRLHNCTTSTWSGLNRLSPLASRTRPSFDKYSCSGFGLVSTGWNLAQASPVSAASSSDVSLFRRLARKRMKAAFIAMRVSHEENLERPWKPFRLRKASRNAV